MIWSKYNYLYKSEKHDCFFLYNSRTNSFLKLSQQLYTILDNIKSKSIIDFEISELHESIKNSLLKAKVFVTQFEDDNFINQKKLVKYRGNFQHSTLGIVILPTYACNFKCPYCYESNLPYKFMTEKVEDQLINFIKSFENCSKLQLCWHGGEPLIAFENIKRILHKINKEDKIQLTGHTLVTNGYLLDREKCLFLKDHHLSLVQITIDGLRENHNKSRIHKSGFPTYDVILENIEKVFEILPNCHVIIRMNVHAKNEQDFPLLHREFKSRWKNQNYSIIMKYANDHNNGCRVECFKDKDKIFYAKKLYEKYNFTDFDLYPKFQLGGCTATYLNSFVIGPEGYIYKCWVDVGKKERKIGDIFTKKYNLDLLSEYIVGTDMFSDPKCLDCLLLPVCDGGCNIKRLNYKLNNIPYDLCPIDIENLNVLFDLFYEQQLKIKTDQAKNVEINPVM